MILAIVDSLVFASNEDLQTVSYNKAGHILASRTCQEWQGTFRGVLAENEMTAAKNLAAQVRDYLKTTWSHLKPEDFKMKIRYTTIDSAGTFWSAYNSSSNAYHVQMLTEHDVDQPNEQKVGTSNTEQA